MTRFLLSLLAVLVIAAPVAHARTIDDTGIAGSDIVSGMWEQICTALPFCDVGEDAVDMAAHKVIDVTFSIITAVAIIVMMYAGIKMISARGNEEAFASAKKVATYTAAGLLIALLAENLVLYVATDLLPKMLGN